MLLEIIGLMAALAAYFYRKHVKNYDYWIKKGVRQLKPKFPYGNYAELAARKPGKREKGVKMYEDFKVRPASSEHHFFFRV